MTGPVEIPRIRRARTADAPAIVHLAQAAYRGEGGWTTEAHLVRGERTDAAEVRALLGDDAVTLLVAEVGPSGSADRTDPADPTDPGAPMPPGTRIVGCSYTRREAATSSAPSRAELGLFAVAPSQQGRGLGSRLLEAQTEALRDAGTEVLMIRVLQSRPELHAWYERRGFVRTGQSVPFPLTVDQLYVPGLAMDVMERPLPGPRGPRRAPSRD